MSGEGVVRGEPRVIDAPFTTRARCLLSPPAIVADRPPPLLVALHGQGESGERLMRRLLAALPPHFAAAFPDGFHSHEVRRPGRPIRIGHAWYLYTGDQQAFAKSLEQAETALWALVERAREELGADPARLYLCGFSQGAYLAHCAALRGPGVAGWAAISGRLKRELLGPWLPRAAGVPVLLLHGRRDEALPPDAAEESAAALEAHGALVTLRLHDAAHELSDGMLVDLRDWLATRD